MRITVTLNEALLQRAETATGISDRKELLEAGLRALVCSRAKRDLIALGGTMPSLKHIPRRRPVMDAKD